MDIKWSHGFTSRATTYPCSTCTIVLADYAGKDTVSFKTDDLKMAVVETGNVSISGENFCHYGSVTGLNCLKMVNDKIVKVNEDWGWVQPNGQINWSTGFSTRMTESKCKAQEPEASPVSEAEELAWSWGDN